MTGITPMHVGSECNNIINTVDVLRYYVGRRNSATFITR